MINVMLFHLDFKRCRRYNCTFYHHLSFWWSISSIKPSIISIDIPTVFFFFFRTPRSRQSLFSVVLVYLAQILLAVLCSFPNRKEKATDCPRKKKFHDSIQIDFAEHQSEHCWYTHYTYIFIWGMSTNEDGNIDSPNVHEMNCVLI